jgi:Bacterial Ig-like domain (group 1)
MTKQQRLSGGWIVGLALALVVFLGALGFVQDAQAAQYNMSLRAPDEVLQYQNTELIAVVTDSQGRPVSGIPVDFRVGPEWEKNVTLTPQRVTTQNGEARITFRSDMPGVVYMAAQAGDTTAETHITVSGSGSTTRGGTLSNEGMPPNRPPEYPRR